MSSLTKKEKATPPKGWISASRAGDAAVKVGAAADGETGLAAMVPEPAPLPAVEAAGLVPPGATGLPAMPLLVVAAPTLPLVVVEEPAPLVEEPLGVLDAGAGETVSTCKSTIAGQLQLCLLRLYSLTTVQAPVVVSRQ